MQPIVGDVVHFFHRGDRTAPPSPGLVTSVAGTMLAMMIPTESGAWIVKQRVHHVDDPRLKENKRLAFDQGAWDFKKAPVVEQKRLLPTAMETPPVMTIIPPGKDSSPSSMPTPAANQIEQLLDAYSSDPVTDKKTAKSKV